MKAEQQTEIWSMNNLRKMGISFLIVPAKNNFCYVNDKMSISDDFRSLCEYN